MLPLISSLATELGGFSDESSGNLPASAAPGREFAGLLKNSVTGQAENPVRLPTGQALPSGGNILPNTLADSLDYPVLELELPLTGFLQQALEPIGTNESGSVLYGLGLNAQPATVELESSIDALSAESAADGVLSIAELTAAEADQPAELNSGQSIDPAVTGLAAAPLPTGLVAGQRLLDPAGSSRPENLLPGLAAAANRNLTSADLPAPLTVSAERIAQPTPVAEQPVLDATRLAPGIIATTESSRIAAEFLKASAERQRGGPTTGPAATTQVSAASAVAAAGHAPLHSASALPQTPLPTLNIGLPVQDPAWSQALGNRVLVMTGQQLQSAEIRLSPAELGPITVNLSIDDGSADLTFVAQHALTRDAIEQALPRLREMLSENGLSLGNASVSEDGVSREGFGQGAGGDSSGEITTDSAAALEQSDEVIHARIAQGLIDTFA